LNSSWEQNQRTKVRTRGGKLKNRNSGHARAGGGNEEGYRKSADEEVTSPSKYLQQVYPSPLIFLFVVLKSLQSQLSSQQIATPSHELTHDFPRRHRSSRSHGRHHSGSSNSGSGTSQLPQINSTGHSGNASNGNNSSSNGKRNLFATQNMNAPPTRHDITLITDEVGVCAVSSIKGLKPGNPNWTNQDNFFLIDNHSSKPPSSSGSSTSLIPSTIACVFDGHGEHGHLVSRRCRELLPIILQNTGYDLMKSFMMIQNDLTSCDIDTRCSGATCNMVFHLRASAMTTAGPGYGKLIIANCGDSRCVLGKRLSNGNYAPVQLSNDHKPDNPDERKRVIAAGGHLGCRQALVNQGSRGMVSVPVGPTRVWYQYKGDTLGLAMSRSLGDSVVHRFGVSAEPEITEYQLTETDEFVILASDGIWDVVDNNQAIQVIQNFISRGGSTSSATSWDQLEAAVWLTKFARARWEKMSAMIDDITCVVMKVKGGAGGAGEGGMGMGKHR
jgi:serine/threonine protein phosphatase PrpC